MKSFNPHKPSVERVAMNHWQFIMVFAIFCLVHSAESRFEYNSTNFTYRCDQNYASIQILVPSKADNVGALRFTTFRKLRNIFLGFAVVDPKSNLEFFNHSINVCSSGKSRSNIFVTFFSDYFLGSIPDMKDFKCPLIARTVTIPERSTRDFAESASKYLPTFAKTQGKYQVTFKIYTKDRSESIAICEIKETWSFKFD